MNYTFQKHQEFINELHAQIGFGEKKHPKEERKKKPEISSIDDFLQAFDALLDED